jgi:integrase
MKTNNAENERIKRAYFIYLREAKRRSEPSIDAVAKALSRFEVYTRFKSFKAFRIEQAVAFKDHLAKQVNSKTGEPLSKATTYATLAALKAFFQWLAGQPGFKSRLTYSDADFFSLSLKDTAVAKAPNEERVPTLEQVRQVLAHMPFGSDIEKRNRALVAFTLLTGARDNAIASMRLKHIDLTESRILQDARQVRTKFAKTFPTYFFPVGDDVLEIIADWVRFLQQERLWGLDDPLFPATRIAIGSERRFEVAGLDKKCWSNATPIRTIFREAFMAAGLPYFNPHSFRKTLVRLGEQTCQSPEEFKAWSQNLGHDSPMTTFVSYGQVNARRQAEIIRYLGRTKPELTGDTELVRDIAELVAQHRRRENIGGRAHEQCRGVSASVGALAGTTIEKRDGKLSLGGSQ